MSQPDNLRRLGRGKEMRIAQSDWSLLPRESSCIASRKQLLASERTIAGSY